MITDIELFNKLEAHRLENDLDYRSLAKDLNVSTSTIFSWKNGGKISPQKRRAILALTAKVEPLTTDFIPACPFLTIVKDRWQELTTEEKAEIAGRVATLADRKKDILSGNEA